MLYLWSDSNGEAQSPQRTRPPCETCKFQKPECNRVIRKDMPCRA